MRGMGCLWWWDGAPPIFLVKSSPGTAMGQGLWVVAHLAKRVMKSSRVLAKAVVDRPDEHARVGHRPPLRPLTLNPAPDATNWLACGVRLRARTSLRAA